MQISIITINFNNLEGLKKTMLSVFNQTYQDFEFIVIDGGSTDGSTSFIEQHSNKLTYWVSEPDKGIYNAMNKGIAKAKGEYVLFLNSGDVFHSADSITGLIENADKAYDLIYGNLRFLSKKGNLDRRYPKKLTFSYFVNDRSLPHAATLIKRQLFDDIFYYNEELRIVSDWEFFICAVCKYNVSYKYADVLVSDFDMSGVSNAPEHNKKKQAERQEVLLKHFPTFIDDYKDISVLKNNRFKALKELENSAISKKINSFLLRIQLLLFKGKRLKDLNDK